MTSAEYPPEVAALLARGAEVAWCPFVGEHGTVVGGVILGVARPLRWDVPRFGEVPLPDGQCARPRRAAGPCILPRPGPARQPVKIAGP
jgi:hypothetical protein